MKHIDIERFLTMAQKNSIEDCIAEIEKRTSAEIKVLIVESSRPIQFIPRFSEKDKERDVLRRAKKEYAKLGIGNTQDDTGILIMISLDEQLVRVLVGEAITKKIPDVRWSVIVNSIILGIKEGYVDKSICNTLFLIGDLLQQHFPIKAGDVNEICNSVIIKK